MATFTLTDVTTYVGGHDATTDTNEVSLSVEVDEQENTTFGGGGWRSRIGGLRNVDTSLSGFWQSGTGQIDPDVFTNLGVGGEPVTIIPDGAAGSTAYAYKAGRFSYEIFGGVGEVAPFSLDMSCTDGIGLVRGKLVAAKQTVNATGVLGSAVTGLSTDSAVSSTQYLYAGLHIFSAGTTITVQVQSDDGAGFATPTTQATFSGLTAAGGYWITRVAGPITDTYYRLNISAITGSFSVAGFIAIQ